MFGPNICETQEMLDGASRAIQIAESLGLDRIKYGPSFGEQHPAYAPVSNRLSDSFGSNRTAIYITPSGIILYTNIIIVNPDRLVQDLRVEKQFPTDGRKIIHLTQSHEFEYRNADWNLVESLLKKLLEDIAFTEKELDTEEIRESRDSLERIAQ